MTDTLASLLEQGASRAGRSKAALLVPDGPTLSYAQLIEIANQMAATLAAQGIRREDRVAMVYPNGPEAVALFLGVAEVATCCPLNPAYKEDEFRFYLEDTKARFLLVAPGQGEAARRALPAGATVLEAEIDADGRLRSSAGAPAGSADGAGPDDVALVLHTSGTTSRPKRVPIRHRNMVASVGNICRHYGLGLDDRSLCIMPLFHVHGLVASTLSTLATGGTVIVPRGFNPLGFWPTAKAYRPTWFSGSPTPHQLILMRATGNRPAGTDALRFVRTCSSALSPAQMERMEECYGVPVLEAYGMTEASHQMASNPLPPDERRPGSVGRGTGVEIETMDEAGNLLPRGTIGEVVIRGANVVDGYESNPEANATSFTNGWFRTGDQGVLDQAGYLVLAGRIKELINRGGEKIAPREVDETLEAHPAVAEAVAFGLPHRILGEEVAAAVVARSDVTEKELQAFCREHLAEFKVPSKLFIVEQIPRTPTGKVQRRFVAQRFAPTE